jgi:cell wall-associated NlpC family hydrolase
MADTDALDAFAGWSLVGVGAIVAFAAWKNVEGGAGGLIKDAIKHGAVMHGVGAGYNGYGYNPNSADGTTASSGPAPTDAAQNAVSFALAQVGKPYRWGATGPDAFDCSGLVQAAYKSAGVSIPRTTYLQINIGIAVKGAPLVGDLLFPDVGHVMLAIGDGTAVEAPHTGDFVKVTPVPAKLLAVRRIVKVPKKGGTG